MPTVVSHELLAEAGLTGAGMGALGGLFLAYDLLGGKSGPLRTIARATGYLVFFFVGYAILIGTLYAIIAVTNNVRLPSLG
jgi:hypothetical protein